MKKILITGAGSGLGAELAKVYGKEGNYIILVGRTLEKLNRVKDELKDLKISSDIIICDIRNKDSIETLVKEIVNNHTKIDYLINNAGVGYFGPLEEVSLDNLNQIIDINVKGTIMITQGLLPYIKERILNIISTAGLKGKINESVYVASKFAIRGFTESLQKELEHKDLKVTAVYMGGMNTPFWENTDHIKDKNRLKSPVKVAEEIRGMDDGREEIIVPKLSDCCCHRCSHELCASKVPIFSNLDREELIEIIKMTGHKTLEKGEDVFLEGMEANTLYIINEGKIKLFKYTKDGKEQIFHILSEGDFFGELNLFKDEEYTFNAEAISPTRLCTLTKDNMRDIILKRPEIALKILGVIGNRLSKIETLVANLATNDVDVRIASLIIELKDKYGHKTKEGIEIKLPITREEMSNYTGVTRETISRKLKKFQEKGIIKLVGNKKILILDEEELEDYL